MVFVIVPGGSWLWSWTVMLFLLFGNYLKICISHWLFKIRCFIKYLLYHDSGPSGIISKAILAKFRLLLVGLPSLFISIIFQLQNHSFILLPVFTDHVVLVSKPLVLPFVKSAQVQRIELNTIAYLVVEIGFIIVFWLYYHWLLPALIVRVEYFDDPTYLRTVNVVYFTEIPTLILRFDLLVFFVMLIFHFHYCLIETFYGLVFLLLVVLERCELWVRHTLDVLLMLGPFLFRAIMEVLIRMPVMQRELVMFPHTIISASNKRWLNIHFVHNFRWVLSFQ